MSLEERIAKTKLKRTELEKKKKGRFRENAGQIYRFSTGVYLWDKATYGGLVNGRIIESFGGESSGKTALSTIVAGSVNKINYDTGEIDHTYSNPSSVWFGDLEHTADPEWMLQLLYAIC